MDSCCFRVGLAAGCSAWRAEHTCATLPDCLLVRPARLRPVACGHHHPLRAWDAVYVSSASDACIPAVLFVCRSFGRVA